MTQTIEQVSKKIDIKAPLPKKHYNSNNYDLEYIHENFLKREKKEKENYAKSTKSPLIQKKIRTLSNERYSTSPHLTKQENLIEDEIAEHHVKHERNTKKLEKIINKLIPTKGGDLLEKTKNIFKKRKKEKMKEKKETPPSINKFSNISYENESQESSVLERNYLQAGSPINKSYLFKEKLIEKWVELDTLKKKKKLKFRKSFPLTFDQECLQVDFN